MYRPVIAEMFEALLDLQCTGPFDPPRATREATLDFKESRFGKCEDDHFGGPAIGTFGVAFPTLLGCVYCAVREAVDILLGRADCGCGDDPLGLRDLRLICVEA